MTSCLCRNPGDTWNRDLGRLCRKELRKREGPINSFFLCNNSHLPTGLGFCGSQMANQEIFKLDWHRRCPFQKECDHQSFPFALSRVAELEAEVLLFGVTVVRVWKEDLGQGHKKP